MKLLYLCLTFAGLQLLSSCGAQTAFPADVPATDRHTLGRNMWEKGKLLYLYDSHNSHSQQVLLELGEKLKSAFGRFELQLVADTAAREADLRQYPLMLVGSPEHHPQLQAALQQLPINFLPQQQQFALAGRSYDASRYMMMLSMYPSPWNDSLPVFVMTALEAATISSTLESHYRDNWRRFLRDRWGYEVYAEGKRLIMGEFDDGAGWKPDPQAHYDFSDGGRQVVHNPYARFIAFEGAGNEAAIRQVAARFEQAAQQLQALSGSSFEQLQPADYYLYASTEMKGLRTGHTDECHLDANGQAIHRVIIDEFEEHESEQPYIWLIRQLLGKSPSVALESGLATYLTRHWYKKGYAYWVARLNDGHNVPSPALLMDNNRFEAASSLVRTCTAGAWVGFLLSHWGEAQFFRHYARWTPTRQELEALQPAWEAYLAALSAAHPPQPAFPDQQVPFLKGFNFAHEGYRIHDGYLSSKAAQSLASLKSLGSNAVAIIPYSFLRDPHQPAPFPIPSRAGSENDESVIRAAFMAKQQGLQVMLKPQLWLGRGYWPGSVEMKTQQDWQQFYSYYEQWIVHYALMAEMYGHELFCVGVEFVKATQNSPQAWKEMIGRLRHIYSGPMTYAANWGEEFENSQIWSALDYIGIDCYYPLSQEEAPSDAELRKGFSRILKKIEQVSNRYQKPVIFTEIGFRSVKAAWIQPHEAEGDKAFSSECQERCYRTVTSSLKGADWCQGIFWWKWPSYQDYRGSENRGFSPNNKAAEAVVREFFGGK